MSDRAQLKLAALIWALAGIGTYKTSGVIPLVVTYLAFAGACYVASFFARRTTP